MLAAWTKGNTSNRTVTALSGKMYIIFKSNGSAVDSGFVGTYTSELDSSAFTPTVDFSYDSIVYTGVPTKFNSSIPGYPGVPLILWKIDGSHEGQRIQQRLNFQSEGVYEVCMQVKGCQYEETVCKYVTVVNPSSPTTINFSKQTFSANSDTAFLKPLTDKANMFFWTISPTSYIMLNAFNAYSQKTKVKPGNIFYYDIKGDSLPTPKIWFLDSTCYTITLNAWNSNDSAATFATLTKSSYICSKDFRLNYGLYGKVFFDTDNDCGFDAGESLFKDIPIKLYDSFNNFIGQTYTMSNGMFLFDKTKGKYKVVLDLNKFPLEAVCPTGIDSIIRLNSSVLSGGINFATTCGIKDIGVKSMNARGWVFPGQQHGLVLNAGVISKEMIENCQNLNDSGKIRLTIKGKVKYKSATITPDNISGNTYTWNIKDFMKFSSVQLYFKTDTNAGSGDTIVAVAEIITSKKDNDTTNNRLKYIYKVLNSYDPNIKETYPEQVLPGYKDWFNYTIRFQNTGTAPAFNIRLEDTLDNRMDMETFELIDYSHDNRVALKDNMLKFYFDDIMLPDSFTDSKGSNGFVQYRIKPKQGYADGITLRNTAYIYFDYNKAVVTNTTLNAYVKPKTYTIDVQSGPFGSVSGSGVYKKDSIVKLTAMPTSCSVFKRWLEAGVEVSTNSNYSFPATGNRILFAEFTRKSYPVTGIVLPDQTAGKINGLGVIMCSDTMKSVTAVFSRCYRFKEWQENNVVVSKDPVYTFLPTQQRHLKAIFEKVSYSINATVSPANSGTLSGTGKISCDSIVNLKAKPLKGYKFLAWMENNVQVATDSIFTFVSTDDRTLTALFSTKSGVRSIDASKFIYPNPATQMLFVKGLDMSLFSITNLQGIVILNGTVRNAMIPLNAITSGLYFLELQTPDGLHILRYKFVKE